MSSSVWITCCNNGGEGIYKVSMTPSGAYVEQFTDMESRGIVRARNPYDGHEYFVVASGAKQSKRRGVHLFDSQMCHVAAYDNVGDGDWHGVDYHNGRAYAVNAASAGVVAEFDPFVVDYEPIEHSGIPDGGVCNDIIVHGNNRRYQSTFKFGPVRFDENGGYTALYPDIEHQQPHSLRHHDDALWWADSMSGNVLRDGDVMFNVDGYARGLCFFGAEAAFVGVSLHRDDAENLSASNSAALQHWQQFDDRKWRKVDEMSLPVAEIYQIIRC